jgi:hypothetical protein
MTIHYNMMPVRQPGGAIALWCRERKSPVEDAQSDRFLKVCSRCGACVGEWETEADQDREILEFTRNLITRDCVWGTLFS